MCDNNIIESGGKSNGAIASVSKVGYPEISKIRAELRKESYLLHPEEEKEHASLNNILSHKLVNFSSANAIKADHLQSFIQNARLETLFQETVVPKRDSFVLPKKKKQKAVQ